MPSLSTKRWVVSSQHGSTGLVFEKPATRFVSWLAKHLPNPDDQREYARDRAVTAWRDVLTEALEDASLSQAELAEKLGKSPSQVSRMLSGTQNLTLHSIADVLWACDLEFVDPKKGLGPLGVVEVALDDANNWESLTATAASRSPPHHPDLSLVLSLPLGVWLSTHDSSQTR